MSIHVRWMDRRDLPDVLRIENTVFTFPWSEQDFIRCLKRDRSIAMAADLDGKVAGYMLYDIYKSRIHILDFAVDPIYQRVGVGKAMVEKLKSKLHADRRRRIHCEVRETNLDAQLFFKAMGFRATGLLHDFYEQTTEDAILFNYRLPVGVVVNQ